MFLAFFTELKASGVPVSLNHLGFRDTREYDLAKGPRTFRIAVLGDSVAFGHGSIEDLTYPRLLETLLRQRHPDVDWQVWNLGVPGYSTEQTLRLLDDLGGLLNMSGSFQFLSFG